MAGTTAVPSLDGSTPLADIEAELQRIARQRLAPVVDASRSHRVARRQRHAQLVGAFDSPEGFVFSSNA